MKTEKLEVTSTAITLN